MQKNIRNRAPLALVLATLVLPALAACNTTEGFGRDVRGAGNAIEGTARETKQDMRD